MTNRIAVSVRQVRRRRSEMIHLISADTPLFGNGPPFLNGVGINGEKPFIAAFVPRRATLPHYFNRGRADSRAPRAWPVEGVEQMARTPGYRHVARSGSPGVNPVFARHSPVAWGWFASRRRLRVQPAPAFPTPSWDEREMHNSGASRRGIEKSCRQSSLRAKRSNPFLPAMMEWIASSRSLSSGAHSRDPLAPRNDGFRRLVSGPGIPEKPALEETP